MTSKYFYGIKNCICNIFAASKKSIFNLCNKKKLVSKISLSSCFVFLNNVYKKTQKYNL